jgi:alpha-D-xyloside xylohydrolase
VLQPGSFFVSGSVEGTVAADGSLTVRRVADSSPLFTGGKVAWSASPVAGLPLSAASLELQAPSDPVYGLGQHHDPTKREYQLGPDNGETTVPLMHWPQAGASLLINVPAGAGKLITKPGGVSWEADACLQLDLWIAAVSNDTSPKQRWPDLMAKYIAATGHPATLPDWATGFIQSKDRYDSQGAVENVTAAFAQRHTPLSMVVIDWQSWAPGPRGDEDFGKVSWPDPKAMLLGAKQRGVELMVSPYHNM